MLTAAACLACSGLGCVSSLLVRDTPYEEHYGLWIDTKIEAAPLAKAPEAAILLMHACFTITGSAGMLM